MKLKILNVILAVVLAVLIGIWAFQILTPREMRPPDIDKELGLNRSEMQKLGDIRKKMMSEHKQIFGKIRELNEDLDKELSKDKIDESAVSNISKDIQAQHGKLAELRVSAIVETRRILGADKFSQMTSMFEKKRKERSMRWPHGPEGPKGKHDGNKHGDESPPPPPEF